MSADNDSVRAEFEEVFPPSGDCEWNGVSAYCWKGTGSYHPQDNLWEAWQASRERYVPKPEDYREALAQAYMAGQTDEGIDPSYSNALAYANSIATPNGGNGE